MTTQARPLRDLGDPEAAPPGRRPESPPETRAPVTAPASADRMPRNGKSLFAWLCDQQDRIGRKFLHQINEWSAPRDLPARITDWTPENVEFAWATILEFRDLAEGKVPAMASSPPWDAPADPDPPPPPSPKAPKPVDRATAHPLPSARFALYRRIYRIAQIQQNTDEPTVDNLRLVMKGLLVLMAVETPVIPSLKACEDVRLLSEYAEAAEEQLGRLEPESQGVGI